MNRLAMLLAAVLVWMATAASSSAQTTVILDAPDSESVDTYIQGGSLASSNFDGGPLKTRSADNLEYNRRTLLKFDTENRVPEGATIQSARLTLTVMGGNSETRTLSAYRVINSFDEDVATWKARKSGYYWSTAGGDLGAKYASATVTGTVGSTVTFDITRMVQENVNSSDSRYTRVALLDLGPSTNLSYREYYPSEASDPSVRPTLTVVYGGSAPAPEPEPEPEPEPAPAPAPETSVSTGTTTLRLLHWNAHRTQRTDGVYDTNGFVDWLVRFNPHVISLNEIDSADRAATIASLLKSKTGVPWYWHYDDRGNQVLTRWPQPSESICLVNSGAGRKATHIGVTAPNGRRINVWSAHLALDSSAVRTAETVALRTCEKGWAEARIAAGDFNMQADTAEYNSMALEHYDAWRAAPTKLNYAGNCDGCTRNSRIDYVFSSKGASWLVLKSAQIFDTRNSSGVMASDHKPMLVTYEVR